MDYDLSLSKVLSKAFKIPPLAPNQNTSSTWTMDCTTFLHSQLGLHRGCQNALDRERHSLLLDVGLQSWRRRRYYVPSSTDDSPEPNLTYRPFALISVTLYVPLLFLPFASESIRFLSFYGKLQHLPSRLVYTDSCLDFCAFVVLEKILNIFLCRH